MYVCSNASWKNLKLTVVSLLSALENTVRCTYTNMHAHTSQFYQLVHSGYCWTLLAVLSALLINWNEAHFPFLCILLFAPTHTKSAHWESLSLLSHSLFLSLALSFPLSLFHSFSPLLPVCQLKQTDKDCEIDFGKTLSTVNVGHSKLFYFLCACAGLPIIWLCS